jgi:hypothetical protein
MTFSLDSDTGKLTGRIRADDVSPRRHDGIRRALEDQIRTRRLGTQVGGAGARP